MLTRIAMLWIIFAALMGFAVGGSVVWSSQPPPSAEQSTPSDQHPEGKSHTNDPEIQSLWVPRDSVGLYTLVLSVFTGILACVSIFQGVMLLRSDKTARIAANAAKRSADAAIAIELPIIQIEPNHFGFGSSIEDGVERTYCNISDLFFANVGRTKAFPIEIQGGWTVGNKLPEKPVYTFSKPFPIGTIIKPVDDGTKTATISIMEFEGDTPSTIYEDLRSRKTRFWFYCSIAYLDFMQIRHDAGFCWERRESFGYGRLNADATPAYNKKT